MRPAGSAKNQRCGNPQGRKTVYRLRLYTVPPLENLTLRQRITDKYLANWSPRLTAIKEPDRWQCRANSVNERLSERLQLSGRREVRHVPKLTRKLENYRGAGMNGSAR